MWHQHRSSWFHRHRSSAAIPKLITCLYNTDVGIFAFSWSFHHLGRSLHLHHDRRASFHLHIKPFPWYSNNKKGSKKLDLIINKKPATIFWDLSNAKYGSGPEPVSGFYVALVVDHEIVLLLGDQAAQIESPFSLISNNNNYMVLRREHVYGGTKLYSTKADIGGHERIISIDCRISDHDDPRLFFSIDNKVVLRVKHLKWKFRGNESIQIEGTCVQVSWDVYNWLFHQQQSYYALFMFTIFNHQHDHYELFHHQYQQQHHHLFGLEEFEEKKMKKNKVVGGLLRRSSERSSSSSSAHSSSSCTSSVMEWACGTDDQEDQLADLPYSGFSLLVYAWN